MRENKTGKHLKYAIGEIILAHSVSNFAQRLNEQSQELIKSIETTLKD